MASLFRLPGETNATSSEEDESYSKDSADPSLVGRHKSGISRVTRDTAADAVLPTSASASGTVSLPVTTRQEHQRLLIISLIEARCRTQAAKSLNAERTPAERLSEEHPDVIKLGEELYASATHDLVMSGVLSADYAGANGVQQRQGYLQVVDAVIHGKMNGLHGEASSSAFPDAAGSPLAPFLHQGLSGLQLEAPRSSGAQNTMASIYATEYQELGMIGKGGYGKVFRVMSRLDAQEYAIKKIFISAQRLQRSNKKSQADGLVAEIRTLARLNHTNIVRYFHGWVETSGSKPTVVVPPEHDNQDVAFRINAGQQRLIAGQR